GPSFASMFTSTYPKDTGIVRHVGIPVPREMTLLPEVLSEAGYATRAVVANGALSREFNYDQGFETYVESWRNPPEEAGLDPDGATRVTDLAIQLAGELQSSAAGDDRPYFLWVHYLDPHFPYAAPEPWTDRFADDGLYDPGKTLEIDTKRTHRQMLAIGYRQVLGGRDDLAYYISRYDAEIAYVDSQVGRLLDSLSAKGLLENTLTVLTSDHGESLGEHHYYFDHGRFGWQTCLRVPLILHFPGVLEPAVDLQPMALIHLAPTILEFAGVELEGGRWERGRSVVPRLFGVEDRAALAFSEAGHEAGKRWQRVVQNRRYKLIYARARQASRWIGGENEPWALYDLENDPEETVNVIDEHPEVYRHLREVLGDWLESGPEAREKQAEDATAMDEETREQLRALGYID
ncbi:MAG: sulfatase-like hydrolase/transferase, partial [Holophagales bacterium]|nr:sulfatase-like hydrolase/transferase [Holophagales bacterium]